MKATFESESMLIQKDFEASDFVMSFNLRTHGDNPFHILFRYKDKNNYLVIRVNDDSKQQISFPFTSFKADRDNSNKSLVSILLL